MERKQELQTAINLQTTENPSKNQVTTRLPAEKQNTSASLLVHNATEEFENGGFTLKTHHTFCIGV